MEAGERRGVRAGLALAAGLRFRLDQYETAAGRSIEEAVGQLGPGLQELIARTPCLPSGPHWR